MQDSMIMMNKKIRQLEIQNQELRTSQAKAKEENKITVKNIRKQVLTAFDENSKKKDILRGQVKSEFRFSSG